MALLDSVAMVSISLSAPSVRTDAAVSEMSSKSSEYCRLLTGRAVDIMSGLGDLDLNCKL